MVYSMKIICRKCYYILSHKFNKFMVLLQKEKKEEGGRHKFRINECSLKIISHKILKMIWKF